jgi:hypothetical protein
METVIQKRPENKSLKNCGTEIHVQLTQKNYYINNTRTTKYCNYKP